MIRIFGAPFDPLDMAERVDIKRAYLDCLRTSPTLKDYPMDPYDFLEKTLRDEGLAAEEIEWLGQFPVASWLRPKPSLSDLERISQRQFTQFLDRNGCYEYYQELLGFLAQNVGPAIPVMVGVDHCLTGAVLRYLKEIHGDYNVLILDSHCDLTDLETRRSYFEPYSKGLVGLFGEKDIYECGSFLHYLLSEKVLNPKKLWIVGTQDMDQFRQNPVALYSQKILSWIKQGMHVLSKEELICHGIPEEIRGNTYISFDMDLGSCASVLAARFLNYVGLDVEQFCDLVDDLSEKIRLSEIELIGLDIMEMDIHFLGETIEGHKDYAGEISKEIIEKLVYRGFVR